MAELRDEALELALSELGPEGKLIPFVLATMRDGTRTHFTLVVERSDIALWVARNTVLSQASTIERYAIVVDTYLRIDGERHDAVIVEVGSHDAEVAHVTAHPYTRAAGAATAGAPLDFERRPSALRPLDPFALAWSPGVTPEFFNEEENHAVHVINHELGSMERVVRTIRFVRARARHFARHLPANARQSVFIEDRGQDISAESRDLLARGLADVVTVGYVSELRK